MAKSNIHLVFQKSLEQSWKVKSRHCCKYFGEVVEGSLELLAYETEESLDCVTFGCTYYGTDKDRVSDLVQQ